MPIRETGSITESDVTARNVVAKKVDNIEEDDSTHIESVLAKAIEAATIAGRFDVVSQLCRELEARRLARSPNVVRLDEKRGHKGAK